MRYMSEREFNSRLKQIQAENIQKARLQKLKQERDKFKTKLNITLPSTSKLILLVVSLLCLEIVIFCEWVMVSLQDTSAMYVLIGIPASLIPIVLGYYSKSKAENTIGGIKYDSVMSEKNQFSTSLSFDDSAVG